jgi:hypothetical protein
MTAKARLSPRAAGAAIAVIALAGAAATGFALTRPDDQTPPTTLSTSHGHGDGSPAAVTPADEERAEQLIAATSAGISGYADAAAAEAAGYRWIGDGADAGQFRHFVQPIFLLDPDILDPNEAESLVYRTEADGSLTLVSAMYILPPGSTLDDAPDVAGDLARWHDHTDLCWSSDGTLSSTDPEGLCPDGSAPRATPPMLHVWIVDNPEGPFAGIDVHGGTFE